MRILVYLAYLIAAAMVATVLFCGLLVVLAGWALWGIDEGAARPRGVVQAHPPASRWQRLVNRLKVCLWAGHRYRCAFPIGRLEQQCTRCGARAPRVVVSSFRTERV